MRKILIGCVGLVSTLLFGYGYEKRKEGIFKDSVLKETEKLDDKTSDFIKSSIDEDIENGASYHLAGDAKKYINRKKGEIKDGNR